MKTASKQIYVLFCLIFLLLPTQKLYTQDNGFITFKSEEGAIKFDYPANWVAFGEVDSNGQGFFAATARSEDDLDVTSPANIQLGQRAVFFLAFTANSIEGVPPTEASPEALAQFMIEFLASDEGTFEAMIVAPPSTIELANGIIAGRVDFSVSTGAGMLVVYSTNQFIVTGVALAHSDDLAAFEGTALTIISSLEVDTEAVTDVGVVPPLDELLAPDAPVRDVIFDGDMAHEDMHALLFLLNHPNMNVRAITVTGTGEAHCDPGVRNVRALLVLSGNEGIPVACGRETPLVGDHEFPASWRESADAMYGIALPEVDDIETPSAVELLTSVIESSDNKITLIAVGPLTNLGEMLQASPELVENMDEIFVMGGAVNVPGNVGPSGVGIDNSVAEWNIYIDPHAANIVLQAGVPVTLVLLDATAYVPVTQSFYQRLEQNQSTPEATFVYNSLTANLDFVKSGGFQFWDTLTAAIATDETLAKFGTKIILVEESEGTESGLTRLTKEGVAVRVAYFAHQQPFETLFLAVLNHSE